jgi:hypothetical protein
MAIKVAPVNLNDWRVQHFLEWLCTVPASRTPLTQGELAGTLGVSHQQLTAWKNNSDFLIAWEKLYRRTVGSPEKAQAVIEELYNTATERTDPRQVPAARAYLEAIDAVKPKQVAVTVSRSPKELTDDELMAILGERAAKELADRALDDA